MFTEEQLKTSTEFKKWVTGRISLIHNTYFDSKVPYQTYIVLHSDNLGRWTITRFWQSPDGNISVSNDHVAISAEEVFKVLLSDYSRGLA